MSPTSGSPIAWVAVTSSAPESPSARKRSCTYSWKSMNTASATRDDASGNVVRQESEGLPAAQSLDGLPGAPCEFVEADSVGHPVALQRPKHAVQGKRRPSRFTGEAP